MVAGEVIEITAKHQSRQALHLQGQAQIRSYGENRQGTPAVGSDTRHSRIFVTTRPPTKSTSRPLPALAGWFRASLAHGGAVVGTTCSP